MKISGTIPTQYAPAIRTSTVELADQIHFFSDLDFVREFLDAVPDVFLILNEQRQIVYANEAMLELIGADSESAVCGLRPGEVLDCAHAFETIGGCGTTEFCKTCGAVNAILSGLRGKEAVQECRIIRRDGSALDLRVWSTPLNLQGRKYTIFTVTDISHEKRRKALERIFFHDILNTAGGLQGVSELLKEASADELDELKSMVYLLADRLVEEIQAQRVLSAAETDDLVVNPVSLHSVTFLREVADYYRNHEVAKSRYIRIDPNAHDVSFTSDRALLGRVLGNMTKNALEATKPGGTVTLGCNTDANQIEFWVHNSSYMPRTVQLQIFQRSFTTKGSGRGLGTYSIKLLTERYLRGAVSFTSTQAEGTIFKAKISITWPE